MAGSGEPPGPVGPFEAKVRELGEALQELRAAEDGVRRYGLGHPERERLARLRMELERRVSLLAKELGWADGPRD